MDIKKGLKERRNKYTYQSTRGKTFYANIGHIEELEKIITDIYESIDSKYKTQCECLKKIWNDFSFNMELKHQTVRIVLKVMVESKEILQNIESIIQEVKK